MSCLTTRFDLGIVSNQVALSIATFLVSYNIPIMLFFSVAYTPILNFIVKKGLCAKIITTENCLFFSKSFS